MVGPLLLGKEALWPYRRGPLFPDKGPLCSDRRAVVRSLWSKIQALFERQWASVSNRGSFLSYKGHSGGPYDPILGRFLPDRGSLWPYRGPYLAQYGVLVACQGFQIRTLVVWKWKVVLVAQNRQGDLLAQHGALLGVVLIGALLVS